MSQSTPGGFTVSGKIVELLAFAGVPQDENLEWMNLVEFGDDLLDFFDSLTMDNGLTNKEFLMYSEIKQKNRLKSQDTLEDTWKKLTVDSHFDHFDINELKTILVECQQQKAALKASISLSESHLKNSESTLLTKNSPPDVILKNKKEKCEKGCQENLEAYNKLANSWNILYDHVVYRNGNDFSNNKILLYQQNLDDFLSLSAVVKQQIDNFMERESSSSTHNESTNFNKTLNSLMQGDPERLSQNLVRVFQGIRGFEVKIALLKAKAAGMQAATNYLQTLNKQLLSVELMDLRVTAESGLSTCSLQEEKLQIKADEYAKHLFKDFRLKLLHEKVARAEKRLQLYIRYGEQIMPWVLINIILLLLLREGQKKILEATTLLSECQMYIEDLNCGISQRKDSLACLKLKHEIMITNNSYSEVKMTPPVVPSDKYFLGPCEFTPSLMQTIQKYLDLYQQRQKDFFENTVQIRKNIYYFLQNIKVLLNQLVPGPTAYPKLFNDECAEFLKTLDTEIMNYKEKMRLLVSLYSQTKERRINDTYEKKLDLSWVTLTNDPLEFRHWIAELKYEIENLSLENQLYLKELGHDVD